ncbi:MAG: hypothetical protein E6I64_11420 [Chloroflexi bacterium]|nr:MAG: hypothetical protein E6I64_11420 [Chloroflexota bacterium]
MHEQRHLAAGLGEPDRLAFLHAHADRSRRQLRDRPDVHALRRRRDRRRATAATATPDGRHQRRIRDGLALRMELLRQRRREHRRAQRHIRRARREYRAVQRGFLGRANVHRRHRRDEPDLLVPRRLH